MDRFRSALTKADGGQEQEVSLSHRLAIALAAIALVLGLATSILTYAPGTQVQLIAGSNGTRLAEESN